MTGYLLRESSFHAVEALVGSTARRSIGVTQSFGDDALGYFTERLDPQTTRGAIVTAVRQAKRNKAFDHSRFIGLAIDGTSAGRTATKGCDLCRPDHSAEEEVRWYGHHLVVVTIAGTGLTLPVDAEPYSRGDSEQAAGQRLLERAVGNLGRRFADYVVADGGYASAPFLHVAGELGLKAVVRLKANLPELFTAAQSRFTQMPPTRVFQNGSETVRIWDADDFDPWERLNWKTVRVIRYQQEKSDGSLVEAYWLTDFPTHQLSSESLFRLAKSRWEIENQGFNDAKNRYGLAHIPHHHANSILVCWLILLLALTIERLYRLRFLRRGSHQPYSSIQLLRRLRLTLSLKVPVNSS
jgi:hypothetical protein